MRIGLKLTAAFLLIASLVGAAGYLAKGTSREVGLQMERLSQSAIIKVVGATDMTAGLYAAQLAAHSLLSEKLQPSENDTSPEGLRPHGLIEHHQKLIQESLARQFLAAESLVRLATDRGAAEAAKRERARTLASLKQLQEQLAQHQQLMSQFRGLVTDDPSRARWFLKDRLCWHFEAHVLPLLTTHREQAEQEFTVGVRRAERAMAVADQRRGWLIAAASAGAVLLGLFMSRSIGKPLGILQKAALEVGHGRLGTRVAIRSRDEIGVLAAALNRMAADLQERTVSRGYLNNIIQSMREMLIVTDPALRIRVVNTAACAELGYSQDDLLGRPLRQVFAAEDCPDDARLLERLLPGVECRMACKSGGEIPVYCSAAHMTPDVDQTGGVVCVASNVSRQKDAEERLRSSLREKELLLKEVHHRVKNNLQIISSLLNLQAQEIQDPRMSRLFQESQSRIRSMALIHEQLYRSQDLARVDFADYVEQLMGRLRQSFSSHAAAVEVRLDVQPAALPLDLAIPCGMIVNELVSNALEHAFPDGRSGEVRIGFRSENRCYRLTVADNGVGMPGGIGGGEATSMGLQVVQALTRQIRGQLAIEHQNGTAFTIDFASPAPEHPSEDDP